MDLILSSEVNIVQLIAINLSSEDLISFGLSHSSIYKILLDQLINLQKEHTLYHQCTSEMEKTWDMLLPIAQSKARGKSSFQAIEEDQIQCSIYLGRIHHLSVIYTHNPRDIDMYTWLLDGNKKEQSFW